MHTTVWNEEIADKTANLLYDTGAYLVDFDLPQEQWYKWKSGICAPCYCNCRYLNRSYEAYEEITAYFEAIARLKFNDIQLIVGLASAGVSWAARIAARFRLPMSLVRTTVKGYGVGKLVEGLPEHKTKAIIIDDLCGSGETILNAIIALKNEYEIETSGFITVTNWCFQHMWEKFEDLDVKIYSLTSYPSILRTGRKLGKLTGEQVKILTGFYQNPLKYEWPLLNEQKEKGKKI